MKRISFLAIFLILVGIILLLSELGLIEITWTDLLKFWPLILVFWGIDILIGERRFFVWIALLLLILFLALIFSFPYYHRPGRMYRDWRFPYDTNIKRLELNVKCEMGKIFLAMNKNKDLVYISSKGDLNISEDKKIIGDTLNLDLKIKKSYFFLIEEDRSINIFISPDVNLDLTFQNGVGNYNLDLRGLKLEKLRLEGGVGNILAYIPQTTEYIEIKGGIGNIDVYIPEGIPIDLKSKSGLGKVDIASNISKWQGEGKVIHIRLEAGIGNINIKSYKDII
ncbi:MAG: hypothetical protein CBR30_04855 [Dictyoglomus sp. NZ13-RE01]|nr:MAG: hypothetical protein CBR30_04855 [Dictyoglomus sp. NZ13-RE01]